MKPVEFTKEMKKDYTILLPEMLPIHFTLIKDIFKSEGYKVELLTNNGPEIVTAGLQYVHNDTCYPALLVIGQMIDALNSGKYDVHKTALMITQTGGGCRASNYIHLLRKGLENAGYSFVPVISLNISGLEKSGGFHLTLKMILKAFAAVSYGDMLMLMYNQVSPYQDNKDECENLLKVLINEISLDLRHNKGLIKSQMTRRFKDIVDRFSAIKVTPWKKTKVGIVGEIYVKYSRLGNNNLEHFLRTQDCEIMVPGLFGFLTFKVDNRLEDITLYGGNFFKKILVKFFMWYLAGIEKVMIGLIKSSGRFTAPASYSHLKSLITGVVGYGNKMGEGWLLTAEMLELIESGFENVVCTQPFGCLPNHIVGRGMLKKIKSLHANANIVPIDYDPSATRVNQENRIKLMLEIARGGQDYQKEDLDALKAPLEDKYSKYDAFANN